LSTSSRFALIWGNICDTPVNVAAGTGEAADIAGLHRITVHHEHDGDRRGRSAGGCRLRRRYRNDHVDGELDELERQRRQLQELPVRITVLDRDVLTGDVAQLAQSLPEGVEAGNVDARRPSRQHTNPRRLRR
jgi:hypothetical protein